MKIKITSDNDPLVSFTITNEFIEDDSLKNIFNLFFTKRRFFSSHEQDLFKKFIQQFNKYLDEKEKIDGII